MSDNNVNANGALSNQQLLDKLKQASDGLLFMSESEYPFEVFVWQSPEKQHGSRELVLSKLNMPPDTKVEFVDLDSFFEVATTEEDWHSVEDKEIVKRYQNLVKVIKENLSDIKVARLGDIDIDVYIVGKTPLNDFAGLATKVIET
ncbi:nuclease inhibitor homolog [Calothrix sp. NIES-4071]|nr:nuclease inhibitor homolog [Calothrix sp. NIES-4071]BAZ63095.1 nuclease inhibitor homolog [Calothrix sp. NIES-4105]